MAMASFSIRLVCRSSDWSRDSTDISLVTVNFPLCFLTYSVLKSDDLTHMWSTTAKNLHIMPFTVF